MSNIEAYERNLQTRLEELRRGDPAYNLNTLAVIETLPYLALNAPDYETRRFLDVGCGLGFLAARLAVSPDVAVVGIDPSQKSIELAKQEHAHYSNLKFYVASAQEFSSMMQEQGIEPFERAILNMVLHSVDDETCVAILEGVKQTLVHPGILTCVVPSEGWLTQKLIENAKADNMDRKSGIAWVVNEMKKPAIRLRVGISGQPAYKEPLTIYNRDLQDYIKLFERAGYGMEIKRRDGAGNLLETSWVSVIEWPYHYGSDMLFERERLLLITQTAKKPK